MCVCRRKVRRVLPSATFLPKDSALRIGFWISGRLTHPNISDIINYNSWTIIFFFFIACSYACILIVQFEFRCNKCQSNEISAWCHSMFELWLDRTNSVQLSQVVSICRSTKKNNVYRTIVC